MTAWYSVNTLSVQNNSPVATGTGTNFSDFVYPAFGIVIEGVPYEIISIDSATQLTLSKPYRGATKADAEYAIWPTQGLNYELWREATELVDLFGPLTNDMEVLNQQIADTLAAKNAAAVSATNSANSAADSLTRANAAQVSANASAVSATTAAGYATTADNHRLAAAASEANAAASASAANTSKLASASSAADALSLKNATTDLRDETVVAKNDAQTAKTAAENARDAAETAQGLSECVLDASVAAKNVS